MSEAKLRCKYNNPAASVCVTKGCQESNPFVCIHCKRMGCTDRHADCKLRSWDNYCKILFSNVAPKSKVLKNYLETIEELYDRAVVIIQDERRKFIGWSKTLGMPKRVKTAFEDIFKGDFSKLCGNQMWDLVGEQEAYTNEKGPSDQFQIKSTGKDMRYWAEEVSSLTRIVTDYISRLCNAVDIKKDPLQEQKADSKLKLIKKEVSLQTKQRESAARLHKYVTRLNEKIQTKEVKLAKTGPQKDQDIAPEDIEALQAVNGRGVLKLDLNDCTLQDISFLARINFPDVKTLSLQYNSIRDISPLSKCLFLELTSLVLSYNQIQSIASVSNWRFPRLTILNLSYNQIKDINPLSVIQFKELRTLSLHDNNITTIQPLRRFRMPVLTKLSVYSNKYADSELKRFQEAIQAKLPSVFIQF